MLCMHLSEVLLEKKQRVDHILGGRRGQRPSTVMDLPGFKYISSCAPPNTLGSTCHCQPHFTDPLGDLFKSPSGQAG